MRTPKAGDSFLGWMVDTHVESVRAIEKPELEEHGQDLGLIREFHRESQAYEHVIRDNHDLVQYMDGIMKIVVEHGKSPDIALDFEIEINRRVMACLSSFKTFLDHSRHALSRRFGGQSAELTSFDGVCSLEYDSEFDYRLASKLKNYSQHRDLPVGFLILEGKGRHGRNVPRVEAMCVRDQLLQSGFEWKTFRSELEAQPDHWNIHSSLNNLLPSLARIRAVAIEPIIPNVVAAARRTVALASEAGFPDKQPAIVEIIDPDPKRTNLTVHLFPVHFASRVLQDLQVQ